MRGRSGAATAALRGRANCQLDLNKTMEEENTLGSRNETSSRFSWILVIFDEMHCAVHAYPTTELSWGARRTLSECRLSDRFLASTHASDSSESNANRFGELYFQWKSWYKNTCKSRISAHFGYPWQGGLLLCHFEIEQAARGTSRGRGNGAWCSCTRPRMSTVSSECPRMFVGSYTGWLVKELCDFTCL